MEFLTTQKWEFFVKIFIKKITIIWYNFSLLKKWEFSGTYSAIKVTTIWWNFFHVVKVVNTTDPKTTPSINFIPITIFGVVFYGPSGLTVRDGWRHWSFEDLTAKFWDKCNTNFKQHPFHCFQFISVLWICRFSDTVPFNSIRQVTGHRSSRFV